LAGWALGLLFAAMFVCLLFDREAEKVLRVLAWLGLVLAAATDRHAHWRKHWWKAVAAWTAVIAATTGAAWLWGDFAAALSALIKYQVGVIWLALVWIALPVFVHADWRRPGQPPVWALRWAGWLGAVLLSFCFYATLSAGASLFPKESFELLGGELLPYAGMFVIIKRMSWCVETRWWQATARTVWGVVVVASLAMAAVMLLALASRPLSDAFLQAGLFRVDSDAPGTRRLQFLFSHHNRAGFFSAVAIFLCLAGAWGGRAWRILGICAAAAAAFALPFTLTRGALVAAALGMLLFIAGSAMRHRRGGWIILAALIVLLPAAWLALPQKYQQHISKITNPANYQEHAGGSIGARLVMWQTAAEMIVKRPALGFGYGFENFESTARLEHPKNPEYFAGASHAHNHWLETAAETGIPGALLLFALTVFRIGGLVRAWWRSTRGRGTRPDLAWLLMLWLCLELLIQFYGMTNYTLRRNLGFLTYWIWAGSVVLVLRAEYWPAPERDDVA
jgi:O-antigen ligase